MSDFWQAAAGWAVHTAAAGGGVLLLGWIAGRMTSAPARRQRTAAWAVRGAVIAAVLCLCPAWLTVPRWEVTDRLAATPGRALNAHVPNMSPTEEWVEPVFAPDEGPDVAEPVPVVVPVEVSAPVLPSAPLRVAANRVDWESTIPYVMIVYAVVAFTLVVQLAAGHIALWRLRRTAASASDRAHDVLDTLIDGSRKPDLLVSDRVETPVCFGPFRPVIVLPRQLTVTASDDELRWVLAHELDHLCRGDPATAVWAGVARGLFFYLPWFWAIRRDLALTQEYLADAAAAAADGRAADYAAYLVDLSDSRRGVPSRGSLLAAHAVMAGRSDLFRRVNMLLKSEIDRRCPRGWTAITVGGLMSAAVVLSGLGWAVAEEEKPVPPPPAEKKVPLPGDRPKADRDGDRKPDPSPQRKDGVEINYLKKQIENAVKDGNAEEVRSLVNQLEQALARRERRDELGLSAPPMVDPAVPGTPSLRVIPVPRVIMDKDLAQRRAEIDRAQKAMQEALELLQADREAGKLTGPIFGRTVNSNGDVVEFGPSGATLSTAARPLAGRLGVMPGRIPEALSDQLDLPRGTGLLVVNVGDGSVAAKAGLKRNDVLLKFAGKDAPADERKFMEIVANAKAGEKTEVVVLRKGKRETLTVELPEPVKVRVVNPAALELGGRGPRVTFESMAMKVTDGGFEVTAAKGDTKYAVSGTMNEGTPTAEKLTVTEGDETKTYQTLKEMSEKHRAAVKQLLSNVGGR